MIDGGICHDQPKIANYFCNYFANIAHGMGNNDSTSDDSLATHASVQSIIKSSASTDNFHFQRVNKVEVEIALQGLNTRKSDGWNGIPSLALKVGASELSIPLTTLHTACISSCEWPSMWKRGHWVPVFKKEDPRLD